MEVTNFDTTARISGECKVAFKNHLTIIIKDMKKTVTGKGRHREPSEIFRGGKSTIRGLGLDSEKV